MKPKARYSVKLYNKRAFEADSCLNSTHGYKERIEGIRIYFSELQGNQGFDQYYNTIWVCLKARTNET